MEMLSVSKMFSTVRSFMTLHMPGCEFDRCLKSLKVLESGVHERVGTLPTFVHYFLPTVLSDFECTTDVYGG